MRETKKEKGATIMETKDISIAALASISTGVLLCSFSEMHEAAEWLMGHPIWTSNLASGKLLRQMREAVDSQVVGLPQSARGVNRENYAAFVREMEIRFGKSIKISKGGGLTAMRPTDGMPDHLTREMIVFGK